MTTYWMIIAFFVVGNDAMEMHMPTTRVYDTKQECEIGAIEWSKLQDRTAFHYCQEFTTVYDK